MTYRLRRIPPLVGSLTVLAATAALTLHAGKPLGIGIGGLAALLDFLIIAQLVTMALRRRPSTRWVVPLAFLKSMILITASAAALFVPSGLANGASFAIGVSALPLAIVIDALLPTPPRRARGAT